VPWQSAPALSGSGYHAGARSVVVLFRDAEREAGSR
jgi:hypothetical protein